MHETTFHQRLQRIWEKIPFYDKIASCGLSGYWKNVLDLFERNYFGYTVPVLTSRALLLFACVRSRINTGSNAVYAEFMTDGDMETVWRSATGETALNITIDLLGLHDIDNVTVTFGSFMPQLIVLEFSSDSTMWHPVQYYGAAAGNMCQTHFALTPDAPLANSSDVGCRTTSSSTTVTAEALTGGELTLALQGPGATRGGVPVGFAHATHVRLRVLAPLFPLLLTQQRALTDGLHVVVADVAIAARCVCHGHGNACAWDATTRAFACVCSHNTTGATCDRCLPLFNDAPWRAVTEVSPMATDICQPCACNGHADECVYNATLEHGVCTCMHNTMGTSCDECAPGYYRNPLVPVIDVATCLPCSCNSDGTIAPMAPCSPTDGQCACHPHVTGRACDTCAVGYFGLGEAAAPSGCQACVCDPRGVLPGVVCNGTVGACVCKTHVVGDTCDACATGFFNLSTAHPDGCVVCDAQCVNGCTGAGPTHCVACRAVRNNDVCVARCPLNKTADSYGVCQPCSPTLPCARFTSGGVSQDVHSSTLMENVTVGTTVTTRRALDVDATLATVFVYSLRPATPTRDILFPSWPTRASGMLTQIRVPVYVSPVGYCHQDTQALEFDGQGTWIDVPLSEMELSGEAFSIATLVQPRNTSGAREGGYLWAYSGSSDRRFLALLFDGQEALYLFYRVATDGGGEANVFERIAVNMPYDAWHMVAVAVDNVADTVAVYHNLQRIATVDVTGRIHAPRGLTYFRIGVQTPGTHHFNGRIQQVWSCLWVHIACRLLPVGVCFALVRPSSV